LRTDAVQDFQALAGFYAEVQGRDTSFTFPVPSIPGLSSPFMLLDGFSVSSPNTILCRFDDDSEDLEEFMSRLWSLQSLKLWSVRQ